VDQGQNRCAIGVDAAVCGYPKQNALAKTLREIDRLERTLFTLDWISDPALRQRASAGLNKGEARNALARRYSFIASAKSATAPSKINDIGLPASTSPSRP
jgi:TnpA family transposase